MQYGYQEFDRLWRAALERERPVFREGALTIEQYANLADEILRGFVAAHQDAPCPRVVEHRFELPWNGHVIAGVIDRVDDCDEGLIVVDYKTSQRKPKLQDVHHDLQLTLYAYAAESCFERPIKRVIYYHLRDQTQFPSQRSSDHYRFLTDSMLPHIVNGIEGGMFEPHYGYWCKFCGFRELCQAEGPNASQSTRRPPAVAISTSTTKGGENNGLCHPHVDRHRDESERRLPES